jgi:hypothetical protein
MANIMDYLRWRGDLSFSQDPPNEVDALIFSALSYIQFGCEVETEPRAPKRLREAAADFSALVDIQSRIRVKNDLELLQLAAGSRRFGNSRLCMYRDLYIPEQETQFAAVTFLLDDDSLFLAFRGTDYTLTGWKEDFNMTFQQTVPAQRLALQYTREVAMEYSQPMRLGGHSKGGNLAVFAAARCGPLIQPRIVEVYNQDGPGFTEYLMGDPGYLAMVPRIQTLIPQSSVIGMLLEHEEEYRIVKSKTVSLLQHDPYSWEVMGKNFLAMEELTADSKFLDVTIKNWFADMTNQQRNQLVDVMFGLLGAGGVDTVQEIISPKNIRASLKTLSSDVGVRKILSSEFTNLLEAARKTRASLEGAPEPEKLPDGEMQG